MSKIIEKIPSEKYDLIIKIGFSTPPEGDDTMALEYRSLAFDTLMIVDGEHSYDHAYIHYAIMNLNGENYDGFFYAPSLLEELLHNYRELWDINEFMKVNFGKFDDYIQFLWVGGVPMLYVEISDYEWQTKNLSEPLSTVLKLVGQLDFLLPNELEKVRNK